MIRRMILAMAAVTAAASTCWAQRVEFKGVIPGTSTAADVLSRYPGASVSGDSIMALYPMVRDARCGRYTQPGSECEQQTRDSFALPGDYQAQYIAFDLLSKDGPVGAVVVRFNTATYLVMRDAIALKYGPPTSLEREPFRTKGGAEFTSEVARWHLPDGRIVVRQRHGRLEEALAEFATMSIDAKRDLDRQRTVKDGASRL